jgi:RNA polymerase sigma-70 factor (ECF subfamily)
MTWKYADELEREYINDLEGVKQRLEFLKKKEAYLSKLKKECEEQGKWKKIPIIVEERADARKRIKILGEVISSSMYSIEWLRDAKEPGARREISNRSRYHLVVVNKFRFDSENLSDDDLKKLDDYMSCLTDREKEAINSVVAKGNSYQETAEYMGVSRSTVQSYVNRGMEKLNKSLIDGAQTSLF